MKEKRLREMSWEDYGISRHRYEELRAFCQQYGEKKQKMACRVSGASRRVLPGRTGTEDISYPFIEFDPELGRIPMGKTDFYARRKLFYHFLDRLKSGDKTDLLP